MHINVIAEVEQIKKDSEYLADYSKKIEFTSSVLHILKNKKGITGTITVREQLEFGALVKINIDTDSQRNVVENMPDTPNKIDFQEKIEAVVLDSIPKK